MSRTAAPRPEVADAPSDAALSRSYLIARLSVVDARVASTVSARRRECPESQFRGLYLTEQDVDDLLVPAPAPGPGPLDEPTRSFLAKIEQAVDQSGHLPRLRRLARRTGLTDLDVEVLLAALAPDVDARFERLYGYLHDDVTRRRPSVGLALEIAGVGPSDPAGRGRFDPAAPLVRFGLVAVEEPTRPFLGRVLRVPDVVTAHLLGVDTVEPAVAEVRGAAVGVEHPSRHRLGRAVAAGARLSYLRGGVGAAAPSFAVGALDGIRRRSLVLDLDRADPARLDELGAAATRHAVLDGAVVVAGPVDALGDERHLRKLAELPVQVVLYGAAHWDSRWSRTVPYLDEVPVLGTAERAAVWRANVDGTNDTFDPAQATQQFRLTPEQIDRAVVTAEQRSRAEDRPLSGPDLQFGARAQNSAGLERLARRLVPRVGWDELVLPPVPHGQLRELASRARRREQVLDEWGMGTGARRRGIIALFAGPPGTGKTMAAEVMAADLGLDLYVINLATVVDKYIGETEKNLERIFAEAEGVNCILFFDEADALFGKRSEVKDARDRYANVEISYLLQRMERFDGTAILATNLKANVDEAFARRLDVSIDFQIPEPDHRLVLWRQSLRPGVPVAPDLDLEFLANAFELSGGSITNIAVTAAFLAAEDGEPVRMADLIRATEREYRKLGHLRVRSEFGEYFGLLDTGS